MGSGSAQAASLGAAADGDGTQHRSTIAFPYSPLRDVEQIAKELHEKWGDSASPEQLAGGLGTTPRSGAFRMKVASARIFGAVEVGRGKVSLTPLGGRLLDPQSRSQARVEAFFTVPLFDALFNAYKGSLLPPDPGLERKIAELGVSPKQTARARQTFQRSAELAGFFEHGRGRLIEPAAKAPEALPTDVHVSDDAEASSLGGSDLPAAVADLWLTLLRDGKSWPPEKTQEFVEAARTLHELLAPVDG